MSGGPYPRGNPINLVQRFWRVDALTGLAVLANPDTVTFKITSPDGDVTTYVFGTDLNVSNPEPGVFVCLLQPPLPTGTYHYYAVGVGAVQATSPEEMFEIVENEATTPDPPTVPVPGPCTQWIAGQDVANCVRLDYDLAPFLFDSVAFNASAALFEITGRQFQGMCERTVRPASSRCGCWGAASTGLAPYWWSGSWGSGLGWGWRNERGDRLGCQPMSRIRLGGYPVREILEVKIDGTVLPEFDAGTGARNWRLDDRRVLTRMDAPGVAGGPITPGLWPGCQNMSLDDDQPGTFSVSYRWGLDVPQLGRSAAVEVANQLWLACGGDDNCELPAGVTKVVRQGIEIERGFLANWLETSKQTGLVSTDLFLAAHSGGMRRGRRSGVWSPDQQQVARKLGA